MNHLSNFTLEQEFYENAPCGYISTRSDGTIIRVNQTFLTWTGFCREELLEERRFQDLVTMPGRIFYETHCAPLLRMQGFVKGIALDLVCKSNQQLPILLNAKRQENADGKPPLLNFVIFDASERKQYERELLLARRKAEQLAEIVMTASEAILTVSSEGIIQTWNPAAESMFGFSAAEAINSNINHFLVPAERAEEYQQARQQLQAGRVVQLETVFLHKDGRAIEVELSMTSHIETVGDGFANSLIIRDITTRKRMAEALHKNNALLEGVISSINDGIYVRDLEGRYLLVNKVGAELVGLAPEEMVGKKYTELFPAEVVAEIQEEDSQTLTTGEASRREQISTTDGEQRISHSTRSAYRDVQGNIVGILSVIHDISELKAAEDALRISEENFRSLFESMPLGVVYQDNTGKITNANAAAQTILGLTLDEMQDRESVDPRWRATRADGSDFPAADNPAMLALGTGQIQRNIVIHLFNPRKNDFRYLRVDSVPQCGPGEQKPYQVYSILRDITEQRLANQKLAYHAYLLDNMYDAVIATDAQFKLTVWNRGAEQMYGWQSNEVLGQQVREVIRPEISEEVRRDALQELQTNGRYRMEMITHHKDGRAIPTESITVVLNDSDGQIIGYLSINRDVSERKQAEEAVHSSMALVQQQLAEIELLYATTPIGLAVLDRDLRYVRINEYLATNNGYSVAEHIGRTGAEIIPSVSIQLDDRLRQVMETGEPLVNLEVTGYTRAQPEVERIWQESFYPLYGHDGKVIGVNIVVHEITERKRTEAALQESEERFRATFEQAAVGIVHYDSKGSYKWVNNCFCEMVGYSRGELLQKTYQSIIHPEDLVAKQIQMQKLVAGECDSYSLEKRLLRKDGTHLWVNVTVSMVRNFQTSEPEYFIGVVEDIFERKQYEQALQELNATLEQRVAVRSKQLQTSNTKLLESESKLRQLSQQLMQLTEQERKRISREIHDQLGQSLTAIKMEIQGAQRRLGSNPAVVAERLQSAFELLDSTVEIVRRIAADLRPSMLDHFGLGAAVEWHMQQFKTRNDIDYILTIAVDDDTITPDMATAAYRILQEALTNVVRHAKASKVQVELITDSENFTMLIRDNGSGLSEAAHSRPSLGLVGMSERAHQLGGEVELSSSPGSGTTVRLTLPFQQTSVEVPSVE